MISIRSSASATLLALAISGCVCVDTSKLTAFKCNEGGACAQELICCGDGVCRVTCAAGAGGGSSGGGSSAGGIGGGDATGGGSTGGGSAGGAGVGGGNSGGGAAGCQDNQPCSGNTGAPCRTGVTLCQNGTSVCIDGASGPNGAACGANLVCRGGACVSCTAGTPCTTNADPCVEGETVCGAMATCSNSTRQRPAGSACGVGRVCTSAGMCITCAEGTSCSGNPSAPCVTGVVRCDSGSAVCADGPPAASGLGCGVVRWRL